MSDAEFSQRIVSVSVFARIMPAQNLHIVRAIKADDQVVATVLLVVTLKVAKRFWVR